MMTPLLTGRRLARGALALVVGALAAVATPASAQQAACLAFEHAGYKGDVLALTEGQVYRRLNNWNDRISSLRMAPGCEMRVGYRKSFGGRTEVFGEDVRYVGDRWNDVISSVSCTCQTPEWRQGRRADRGREQASQAACVVYDRRDFGGQRLEMKAGQVYERLRNWNDRVASARVREGCAIRYGEHWNFGGAQGETETDLRFVGSRWSRRISALACECSDDAAFDRPARRGQSGPPRPSRDGAACLVFSDDGFSGAWRAFEAGEQDRTLGRRLDSKVSSVQVASGCVALLDVNRPYKIWIDQNVRRFPREQNDRADTVSCFCPSGWR